MLRDTQASGQALFAQMRRHQQKIERMDETAPLKRKLHDALVEAEGGGDGCPEYRVTVRLNFGRDVGLLVALPPGSVAEGAGLLALRKYFDNAPPEPVRAALVLSRC